MDIDRPVPRITYARRIAVRHALQHYRNHLLRLEQSSPDLTIRNVARRQKKDLEEAMLWFEHHYDDSLTY